MHRAANAVQDEERVVLNQSPRRNKETFQKESNCVSEIGGSALRIELHHNLVAKAVICSCYLLSASNSIGRREAGP